LTDFIADNLDLYRRHAREFERIFGCKLKPYFDNLTGFDLVKFDHEVLKPRESESGHAAAHRQWGDEGLALIKKLIKMEETDDTSASSG